MADRQNFSRAERELAFAFNAAWLRDHWIDGIEFALDCEPFRRAGVAYYCENCLFCHTDRSFFDVDHLVPDRLFKLWGDHPAARYPGNMILLCKSLQTGDFGCNQSKGGNERVPRRRGLAFTRAAIDMNCFPVQDRPFPWT
jgi:hypothetical protein